MQTIFKFLGTYIPMKAGVILAFVKFCNSVGLYEKFYYPTGFTTALIVARATIFCMSVVAFDFIYSHLILEPILRHAGKEERYLDSVAFCVGSICAVLSGIAFCIFG